jgi:hypothetical protein
LDFLESDVVARLSRVVKNKHLVGVTQSLHIENQVKQAVQAQLCHELQRDPLNQSELPNEPNLSHIPH